MFKLFIKIIFYIPIMLIYPTKIIGKSNVKKVGKSGAILACNHLSNLDGILLTMRLFCYRFRYLSKIEMSRKKFSKWFWTKLGSIFIDRSKADIGAMKQVIKVLKNNEKIMIFPEGTRNKSENDENMNEMKGGVVYFASKTGAYILPAQILHRPRAFHLTKIVIGEPYKIEDSTKEGTEKEIEILHNKFLELRNNYTQEKTKSKEKEV